MRANGTDSFTTSRTLSHGIGLWVSETIHPVCLPFLLSPFRMNEDTFSSISHWQPEFSRGDVINLAVTLLDSINILSNNRHKSDYSSFY